MSDEITLDLDSDGTADVIVKKTNGHTVYLNLKWALGMLGAAVTSIAAVVFAYFKL